MHSFPRTWALIVPVIGLWLGIVPALRAQNAVRVVRLSRAEGQVLVSHPGSDAWDEAPVNLPLQEGDTLATQAGLAEIEFENGATGYLAENSVLQFTLLGFADAGRMTTLQLSQGAGTFYANLPSQDSFRVQTSAFEVAIPERSEFRVDAFSDGAAVEVFLGNVTVSTAKGSTALEKGQSVAVHERDFQDLNNIARLPEEDAFDQWVTEQGEIIRSGTKDTLSYVNSPSQYGLSDLAIYGNWINLAGFGMSWRPFATGLSWTPYINGVWVQDARLGWIWVSNEAWGWMPYHFGSWTLSPVLGWVWVPGGPAGLQQWEPACVNWVNIGGRTAWVARSPLDREGAPANLAKGVISRAGRSATSGSAGNELLTGKALQNATTLKAPPAEFTPRHLPGALQTRESFPTQKAPETAKDNHAIVFDRGTRTYINGDNGARAEKHAPVPPPALMPRLEAGNEAPRVPSPSTLPAQMPVNRVFAPPRNPPPEPYEKSGAARTAPPARPAPTAPVGAPHPVAPPPQRVSPPAPPQRPPAPAQPPPASAQAPASRSTTQPSSSPRAATPAQAPPISQPQAPARQHSQN
jgi:hypothetical protein